MTATLAAILIESGDLSWETTIADGLPDLKEEIDAGYWDVTLDQLLRHQGGIAERRNPMLAGLIAKYQGLEGPPPEMRRTVLRDVLSRPPTSRPGSSTEYSNYGYVTAAAMLEDLTGRSWESMMKEEIFEPLDMVSADVFSPVGPDVPVGHTNGSEGWQALEPGPQGFLPDWIGPAGLCHASLRDWARFVEDQMAGERGEGKLLSAESYRHLHQVPGGSGYACGWSVQPTAWAKGLTYSHNGSDNTWYSLVTAAPELDLVLLVGSNCGLEKADAASQAVVLRLLEALEIQAAPQ